MATKDTDDRPVVEQLPAGGKTVNKDISRQRRKIIKASAAAVPAIMTLRSGAAAAMNSSYQCFNHGKDDARVDLVINDPDPPHDEWLRVEAIPGYVVIGANNSKEYYGVKNAKSSWINAADWTWYYLDDKGKLKKQNPNSSSDIDNGWDSKTAFYCIAGIAGVSDTVCWDEYGNNITYNIPSEIIAKIEASTTLVKLLAYYDPETGVTTYYPMDRGEVNQPITESCMCSIRPISQLLG